MSDLTLQKMVEALEIHERFFGGNPKEFVLDMDDYKRYRDILIPGERTVPRTFRGIPVIGADRKLVNLEA